MRTSHMLAAALAAIILSGTARAEETQTPKTLEEVSESPFYLKGDAKWQLYFVERLRRYDSRLDYVEDQGPVIDGKKKEIEVATPTLNKLVAAQPKLKNPIKGLNASQKAKLEEFLSKSGMTAAAAFEVMTPILDALKTDVSNDKALDAPLMTPISDRLMTILSGAKCTQEKAKPEDLEAKEKEVADLIKALDETKDDSEKAQKADELATAKVDLRALKRLEKWVCPSDTIQSIRTWIADISKLDQEVLGDKRDVAIDLLNKAAQASAPELKILYGSSALDLWPRPENDGSGECTNDSPIVGKSILGENRPWWLPATHVRFTAPLFKGSQTDSRYGKSFKVENQGFALNLELEVDGAWRFTQTVSAIYGAGIAVGYRKTVFLDETVRNSAASTWFTFTGFGMIGLNYADWVSAYFLAEGIAPGGYGFGGGAEVTGLPVHFGLRVLHEHTNNNTNTGAVRGNPANFDGLVFVPYAGVLF